MIKRIVKMTFKKDKSEDFIQLFGRVKSQIRNFPGCKSLELGRDTLDTNIFFTISVWEEESHLEEYRNSNLFRETWELTKSMFDKKAKAWSLQILEKA